MPAGVDEELARAIGKTIAAVRKARGMTQEQLRRRVGNSKNAVSNWERGLSAPTVQNLRELCLVLDIAPGRLLGMNGSAPPASSAEEAAHQARQLADRLTTLREDAENVVPSLIDALREAEAAARRIGEIGS